MLKLHCVKECCVCKKVKEVSRKIHSDEYVCRECCSFVKTELGKDLLNEINS